VTLHMPPGQEAARGLFVPAAAVRELERSEWEILPYDPNAPRLDPGGCPETVFYRSVREKIARLYNERRSSRWKKHFSQFLLAQGLSRAKRREGGAIVFTMHRRGDRLEAIVLVLLAMIYRMDLVTRDVYLDGRLERREIFHLNTQPHLLPDGEVKRTFEWYRQSNRGLSLATIGRWTKLSRWRVNRAINDIKDAGLEYFHPAGNGNRRFPNRQPRRQKDPETGMWLSPEAPWINGAEVSSEPALRRLDVDLLGHIFDFSVGLAQARRKAADERGLDLTAHRGPPKKHARKKRLPRDRTGEARADRSGDRSRKKRTRSRTEARSTAELFPALYAHLHAREEQPPPLPTFDRRTIVRSQLDEALQNEMWNVEREIKRRLGYRGPPDPPPPELLDVPAIEAEARRRLEARGCPF
jgi:hypothetical protein